MVEISGTASVTRRPAGDLDVSFSPATIAIIAGGIDAVHDQRHAAFTISQATGFR